MWLYKQSLSLRFRAQMQGCFVSLQKEAALAVVIGLSKGHPGTSLCVHFLYCQTSYTKQNEYQT